MTKKIITAGIIAIFALIPILSYGQNEDTASNKTPVVKINRLDIVYDDDEYTGIVIDRKYTPPEEEEGYMNQKPFILDPPPIEDEEEQPKLFQTIEDEGEVSEDGILYASFDSEEIHYPKLNVAEMSPTEIHLVNRSANQQFAFPTPISARTTSRFGPRRRRFHYGVDLALPTGEPIYATWDGVVRISKYNKSYGHLIVIRHSNGLETYYAHMSKRIAQTGEVVKAGDVIGLCGNTGRSYGSHLHFEIRYMGNAINPENIIDLTTHQMIKETIVLDKNSFRKVAKSSSGSGGGTYTQGGAQYYKIRSGDTLGKIAKRNGTTVKKLCQLNGIKETTILSIGRRLRIR